MKLSELILLENDISAYKDFVTEKIKLSSLLTSNGTTLRIGKAMINLLDPNVTKHSSREYFTEVMGLLERDVDFVKMKFIREYRDVMDIEPEDMTLIHVNPVVVSKMDMQVELLFEMNDIIVKEGDHNVKKNAMVLAKGCYNGKHMDENWKFSVSYT